MNFTKPTATILKALADKEPAASVQLFRKRAPIVGVLGAKGGVGSTTLTINLAIASAQKHTDVTVIDSNLQQPDVNLMLGSHAKYSLNDLLARRTQLDAHVLSACSETIVVNGANRANFVSPSADLETSMATDLGLLPGCLDSIKKLTDRVYIDLPKLLDKDMLALLDKCDLIVLVVEPSLASITAGKRWLNIFNQLDYAAERTMIAINRTGGKLKHLEVEASASFKGYKQCKLPNVYCALEQSVIAGKPLLLNDDKDAYSKAVRDIANQLDSWISG